ncbi:hypothetical protein FCULG_00004135 [Fusarium culmorum]|uniref:Uncharacterized protein n=1 Tax=Fusarium culmorum TaxID=5516 RepID=A0A2T4H8G7_FUSCU|nr:hypothetical protein FCULG_00004135 [Fusarium culmorum]
MADFAPRLAHLLPRPRGPCRMGRAMERPPTAPVFPSDDGAPAGPPPGYEPGNTPVVTDTKKNPYEDVTANAGGSSQDEDAKLAARLQAEEDARARSGPGGPDVPAGYGGSNNPFPQSNSPYPQQQQGGSNYPSELPLEIGVLRVVVS